MTYVPPSGPVPCDLALFGEKPGWEEQQQGKGFVGKSGEELWAGMRRYCGLEREDWYVSNIVKEGGTTNKTPTTREIAAALPEVLEELHAGRPRLVVAAGGTATRCFLDLPLSDVHGIPHVVEVAGCAYTVIPIYHPAAGLHQKGFLAAFAYDLQQVKRWLDDYRGEGKPNQTRRGRRQLRVRDTGPRDLVGQSQWLRTAPDGGPGRGKGLSGAPRPPVDFFGDCAVVSLDTEGWPNKPWGLSFSPDGEHGFVIPADCPHAVTWFGQWIRDKTLVLHHGIHDLPVLRAMGITIGDFHDTQVLAYHEMLRTGSGVLEAASQNLGTLAYRELHVTLRDLEDLPGVNFATQTIPYSDAVMAYAGADAIATWRLFEGYCAQGLTETTAYRVDMGQVGLVEQMITNGLPFEETAVLDYYVDVLEKLETATQTLQDMARPLGRRDFNPGSHPQVREIIQQLGLRVWKRTKGGLASTNEKALATHAGHPFVAALQTRRELDKLRGTYLVPLLEALQ